ncbi:MAG: hypothetical protein ACW992_09220, partial [Candidatus Thorarchaeota archaeon]
DSIVKAHIVISYLFAEAPAGDIDFGSGTQETIQVLVYGREETTSASTDNGQLPFVLAGGISITIIFTAFVIFLRRGKQNRE